MEFPVYRLEIEHRRAIGPESSSREVVLLFLPGDGFKLYFHGKKEERSDVIDNEYNNLNN
jgi:hypothetical protein